MKLHYLIYSLFLTGMLVLSGCFPERQPFEPAELETRRPKIAFIVPDDEAVVLPASTVTVWFDELVQTETVQSGFALSLAVARQPWRQIQRIACIARNPLNLAQLMLGRVERGGFLSETSAETWQFHYPLAYSKILDIDFDPQQNGRIYAQLDSGVVKTEDNGVSWRSITDGVPAGVSIFCFAINPTHSAEVWLGTEQGLFRSENGGEQWQSAGELPQWSGHTISRIAFDPVDTATMFVTTLGRYLYKSTDGGKTWEMKRGSTNRLPASRIYDVVVASRHIYVATINAGIYRSLDGGENWNPVNSGITDLNTRRIYHDPAFPNRFFAATATQLFVTEDAGDNWTPVPLPNSGEIIIDLLLNPNAPSRLLLATNASVYSSPDLGNNWEERNAIDETSLQVRGNFEFENWQGQLEFITEEGDTLSIEPHRENDALAAYDAGLLDEPPVEANPLATKMRFTPATELMTDWIYQIKIAGAFQANVWQPGVGVKDIHGNSLEFDQIQYFAVNAK